MHNKIFITQHNWQNSKGLRSEAPQLVKGISINWRSITILFNNLTQLFCNLDSIDLLQNIFDALSDEDCKIAAMLVICVIINLFFLQAFVKHFMLCLPLSHMIFRHLQLRKMHLGTLGMVKQTIQLTKLNTSPTILESAQIIFVLPKCLTIHNTKTCLSWLEQFAILS